MRKIHVIWNIESRTVHVFSLVDIHIYCFTGCTVVTYTDLKCPYSYIPRCTCNGCIVKSSFHLFQHRCYLAIQPDRSRDQNRPHESWSFPSRSGRHFPFQCQVQQVQQWRRAGSQPAQCTTEWVKLYACVIRTHTCTYTYTYVYLPPERGDEVRSPLSPARRWGWPCAGWLLAFLHQPSLFLRGI